MEIKNVSYSYPDGTKVFDNLNLKMMDEKITVIMGLSGSGKTTLLSLINNDISPLNGDIEVNSNIAYMLEDPNEQFITKSVKDELGYQLESHNYRLNEKSKRIRQSLIMVGLKSTDDTKLIRELSLREKRLLALASVLIVNPKVILLDNLTTSLNDEDKNNVIRLIKMLKNRYHRTIIIATNDTDSGLKLADNIVMLKDGIVVSNGDKYSVFKDAKRTKKNMVLEPNTIAFENKVLDKKKIKLGYRDDINDLIKDIYRYGKW
jgi:energy-coupling factor transporter ATP-binding protein EcfA2